MLLDEPFTGVDVKTENAIIELLKECSHGGAHHSRIHAQPRLRAGVL